MNDEQWAHFVRLHDLSMLVPHWMTNSGPAGMRASRQAGEPTVPRMEAVCLVCSWAGTATEAHRHRDNTRHPVVWPTPGGEA